MIFVTVGTQEPFDRLISAIDKIASQINEPIIAQTINSSYKAENMKVYSFLEPADYDMIFNNARLVISHAGMGTIISALVKEKPIIIMPRKSSLKEHRDDHQLATVKKMKEFNYTYVAEDENDLIDKVLKLINENEIKPAHPVIGDYASQSLINSLFDYINEIENN